MKRAFCCAIGVLAIALPLRATITVLDDWRMGEQDGVVQSDSSFTFTVDLIGGRWLTNTPLHLGGSNVAYPTYSTNVAVTASLGARSTNCGQYNLGEYATAGVVSNLSDNFGLELWVNPSSAGGTRCIAYNGNTGGSGWGLYMANATFTALFGGQAFFGSVAAATNMWTHLALVRQSGTATLYVNGVAASSTTIAPNSPSGNFLVAANNGGAENFAGMIDEIRVFTFVAGQFSTNDLELNSLPVTLGMTNLLECPAAGRDTVELLALPNYSWTASPNSSWLHVSNAGGAGSTNMLFSFDANTGATRTGTITLGGHTVTVTQAGATYALGGAVIVQSIAEMRPGGVAVDTGGNVYISDLASNVVYKCLAGSYGVINLTNYGLSGLTLPYALTVDGSGNLYIADANVIRKWNAFSQSMSTTGPTNSIGILAGFALDTSGNFYICDLAKRRVLFWIPAFPGAAQVATIPFSSFNTFTKPAVDLLGNAYFCYKNADNPSSFVLAEWNANVGVPYALSGTTTGWGYGAAVDGGGNVYVADNVNEIVRRWSPTSQTFINLSLPPGSPEPFSTAVDGQGNIFFTSYFSTSIWEIPNVRLDVTPRYEAAAAGNDSLPAVVPPTASLTGPFQPTSDQSWLTFTGITNGVVSYSFIANSGASRTANITLLGKTIPVTQFGVATLGETNAVEGPGAGTNTVVLATDAANSWTATTNVPWLHLAAGSQSGTGSTNVIFSWDANTGATRTGLLTIAGQSLTVTQAGSAYVSAGNFTTLPMGVTTTSFSSGLAVNSAGIVCASDFVKKCVEVWTPGQIQASPVTNTFFGTNALAQPICIAIDTAGNVYMLDQENGAIEKWTASTGVFTMLVPPSAGISVATPEQLAVDLAGNVYLADRGNNGIEKWTASNGAFSTVVSSLDEPTGVAVDAAGNLYFVEQGAGTLKEWNAASEQVVTLSSGLNQPQAVAVDGSGNVYLADTGNNALKEWSALNGQISVLASNLTGIDGVAVDGIGNLYTSQTASALYQKLPRAFIDPSTNYVTQYATSDSLPPVLPTNESLVYPFAPQADALTSPIAWLSISSVSGGVVSLSFTANSEEGSSNAVDILGARILIQPIELYPTLISNFTALPGGQVKFSFTNTPGASFTVLSTTNVLLPLNQWTPVGSASNIAAGLFQFTGLRPPNPISFYAVRSP